MTKENPPKLDPLAAHIAGINDRTQAWVAEKPESRWASTYVEDLAHWHDYGIYTVEDFKKYEVMNDIVETHKEIYGFKPDYGHLKSLSLSALETMSGSLSEELKAYNERRDEAQAEAVRVFEATISSTVSHGAGDRKTAIRWILEGMDESDFRFILYDFDLPEKYLVEFKSAMEV